MSYFSNPIVDICYPNIAHIIINKDHAERITGIDLDSMHDEHTVQKCVDRIWRSANAELHILDKLNIQGAVGVNATCRVFKETVDLFITFNKLSDSHNIKKKSNSKLYVPIDSNSIIDAYFLLKSSDYTGEIKTYNYKGQSYMMFTPKLSKNLRYQMYEYFKSSEFNDIKVSEIIEHADSVSTVKIPKKEESKCQNSNDPKVSIKKQKVQSSNPSDIPKDYTEEQLLQKLKFLIPQKKIPRK